MSKRKTGTGKTLATLRREHQERALVLAVWEKEIRNEEKEEKTIKSPRKKTGKSDKSVEKKTTKKEKKEDIEIMLKI